eukprot:m.87401 g.87401  ORF g.87401 m.87401 type:complete len:179 (+) comp12828_c1_seq1:192-728(+)
MGCGSSRKFVVEEVLEKPSLTKKGKERAANKGKKHTHLLNALHEMSCVASDFRQYASQKRQPACDLQGWVMSEDDNPNEQRMRKAAQTLSNVSEELAAVDKEMLTSYNERIREIQQLVGVLTNHDAQLRQLDEVTERLTDARAAERKVMAKHDAVCRVNITRSYYFTTWPSCMHYVMC